NGEIDGYMGIYTVQALQSFQEDKEIEPTGHVDAATREILNQ
ncbi:MAG: peptidoglycan-binding protein, partial [Candidatus Magasanikbacteria bacterium]|nr:peptidoglycan-binding protein [Candidatus Magasanikbacteria bacterium]